MSPDTNSSKDSKPLRLRIEDALGAWAHFAWRRAWILVISMYAVTGVLASFVPQLEIKTATEDFLYEDDPTRLVYDRFREQFGQDQIAMLAISPPEIFDLAFFEKLRALHEDLENEVPYLEDITSLINVRSVYGRDDELVVEDLLDELPANDREMQALRDRVLSTPSYRSTGLISQDGRSTTILIEVATWSEMDDGFDALDGFDDSEPGGASTARRRPFLTGPENSALIRAVQDVVARHRAPDFPILAAGGTMFTHTISMAMVRDVPRFLGAALLAIAVLLAVLFRRSSPVLLSIAVVVPAIVSTFGIAVLLHIPFSVTSQLVPSFLLAVGVSYTVHLITIFLRELGDGVPRLEALELALRHSGLPIAMTALTTATGLLSFLAAQMKPIAEMGILAAIGTGVSLVFSLVLLPALLALLPLHAKRTAPTPRIDAMLAGFATTSARHPWKIVIATAALTLAALASMTLLRVSSNPIAWLPGDHPYRVATDFLVEEFGGAQSFELLIDTGTENGLHEPDALRAMDRVNELVADYRSRGQGVSYTNSLVEIAKETHQALNGNDPTFYTIPDERRLLAQELLLFENGGADDLERVVDSQFRVARQTVRSTWQDGVDLLAFIDEAEPKFREALSGAGTLEVTGMSAVIIRTVGATNESMLRSYALALLMISPLMMLLIGSLRAGLVSMVPNLVPILMTLGMMGLTDIPIDMFTLLAGCIAIGLAVDDSIHFIAGFRRYLALGADPVRAVEQTMQSTGRALLFTSIVLTTGFLVLTASPLINLQQVGLLTAFAIASAFLLDVTVTPALLVLTHRRRG